MRIFIKGAFCVNPIRVSTLVSDASRARRRRVEEHRHAVRRCDCCAPRVAFCRAAGCERVGVSACLALSLTLPPPPSPARRG